jgi:CubicO group peptidase (beta-lactamase class C family)
MKRSPTLAGRRLWAVLLLPVLALLPAGAHPAAADGVTPASVQAAVAQLDTIATQALARTGVPGMAIAVVYQDQVIYLKGFGVREVGKPATVDADTVFQLASVSKPVASTVVAGLVGDGLVTWDDRIVDHDPAFQMYDPWVTSQVTLRDMFAHRSGLPDHVGDLLEDIGYGRTEVLHRLRFQKPSSSFRSTYAYTNFGLTEAAVAAAKTTGKPWEDVSVERLYRPLGMTSTSSRFADYQAAPNHAVTHALVDGTFQPTVRQPDAQSPAGGVSSSARDMAQWLRLQLGDGKIDGKQIIDGEALAETHRPQIVRVPPADAATQRAAFYGLGWNVSYDDQGRPRISHSGAFSLGAATSVDLLLPEGLGIVVLTNGAPIGVAEAVSFNFMDLATTGKERGDYITALRRVFDADLAPNYGTAVDYSKPPARPSPALPDSAYTGTYSNDYYGEIEVVSQGGGLVLRLGPQKTAYPLKHYDRDVFLYQPTGENAYGLSAVTFNVDASQRATSVEIEILATKDQDGTFPRVAATGQ